MTPQTFGLLSISISANVAVQFFIKIRLYSNRVKLSGAVTNSAEFGSIAG